MNNNRSDSWSGSWIKGKIDSHDEVISTELINSNLISITRNDGRSYYIATMSLERIDSKDLTHLLGQQNVDFVLNVSNEPYITRNALEFAGNHDFAIGSLGDLTRALRDGDLSNYVNQEATFILRGLRQHTRVSNVMRLDNRRYQVERVGLESVIVLALNDYDLIAESVRSAIDNFPEFHALLTSNPYCQRSSNSVVAADAAGIKIIAWGELLGDLNRKWS
ncbi:MAG: hypothetical protein HQ568_08450 [Calditrichaeota bacterium]|nr:hypothetical protein [Calditrichota bacterium]